MRHGFAAHIVRLNNSASRKSVGGTTKLVHERHRIALTVLVLSLLSVGCRTFQSGPKPIPAAELPAKFRASNQAMRPPLDLTALASRSLNSDLIYPGDILDINVVTGAEEETPEALPIRVSSDGSVDLQLVGVVSVAGLSMTEAEEQIRNEAIARRIYRAPLVSVALNSRQMDRVRVVGAVNEPGDYELPRFGSDLLAAIVRAKGLSETAGQEIEIRHRTSAAGDVTQASFEPNGNTENTVHVDIVEAMQGISGDLGLRDGSVVMVKEQRPEKIYVHGLVPHDGEFELPRDQPLRVTQAVAKAGGRDLEFANLVHVTRFVEGYTEPVVIEVSMREAKADRDANPVLQAGDVVTVVETPTTFTIDFLRKFFRIGFSSTFPGL